MRIGILASGFGGNAQAIFDRMRSGILKVDVGIVISNRPNARVLERAANFNIPAVVVERKEHPDRQAYDAALIRLLQEKGCEAIILAGYMLVLGKAFLEAFPNRILNIHPSLLPSFPGTEGADNALKYGTKLTGASVHFVEEEIDTGPLVIQAAVPIMQEDTVEILKKRIHAVEHRIFPMAVQWLAEGRLTIEGRMVRLAPGNRAIIPPDPNTLIWPPLEEGF